MIETTWITWLLVIFGLITCIPLLAAQLIMILKPDSKQAKDIMIGKDEEWRDVNHKKAAYGLAWADWIIFTPLLLAGTFGIIYGTTWGYIIWGISGAIQVYINTFLCFFEKEYVLPANGYLAYFTYIWEILFIGDQRRLYILF